MKTQKILTYASRGFILFSALSLLSVSLMALVNPQSVMDLVAVELQNTDAYSSIRGVYGGVGLVIFLNLMYLMVNDLEKGLLFLSLFWGLYAISRLITILVEGALGDFGTQWLFTELVLFIMSTGLLFLNKKFNRALILQQR
jgi:hypothetical protein